MLKGGTVSGKRGKTMSSLITRLGLDSRLRTDNIRRHALQMDLL